MKKLLTLALMLLVSATYAQLKPIAYTDGAQKLNGFAAAPGKSDKRKAGVLVLPAWKGIDKHSMEGNNTFNRKVLPCCFDRACTTKTVTDYYDA